MKEVKPGKYILIDGIPCKVVELDFSAPGKHGAAKVRVTAVGVFDGAKRTMLAPSHADIEVPIISKKKAQVVSIAGTTAQLMDLDTYDTFDVPIQEEFRDSIKAGAEVEIIETMGRKAISRISGGQ
ncbi:MAG: translation initiation factor IF-5A [Candidatus Marsarchaeota archaeon]|nr:translation initiation factor IF-5A [Candidatus Marsarchaeota archaeon]